MLETTIFALACTAICIFIIYNVVAICKFGVSSSLSNTFYLYEDLHKGLGWIFTAMMWSVALFLAPAWIELTALISPWSQYLQALPFLAISAIAFVGTAPHFRPYDQIENKVHMISAALAAIFSILWVVIVCWKIMWVIPAWILLIGAIAHLTKTAKSGQNYWWEMVAFGSTFSAILIECILLFF